ncbi:hypothetical protein WJX74_004699 [Apatococcus lobatus]|uniref:Small-subunit processome Utp12 domain-containing protein n=1 Tax=Apatococcus lobatus TaxID=904363 RepID=A0AAW1QH16_9CHLO
MASSAGGSGSLLALNSPGTSLAVADSSGSVRSFDTGTGRLEFSSRDTRPRKKLKSTPEKQQTADNLTAVCWASAYQTESTTSKVREELVILGTATGDVKAVSSTQADVVWRSNNCAEGEVTGLGCTRNPEAVLAAGPDGQVTALSLKTGSQLYKFQAAPSHLSALQVCPGLDAVLVGGNHLWLWKHAAEDQQRLAKYTGHVSRICALATTPEVTSRDPPVQLALGSDGGSELADVQEAASQSFLLGAVSVTGNASVWECTPSADGGVVTSLRAEVSPASLPDGSRPSSGGIVAVSFPPSSLLEPTLLVISGPLAKPAVDVLQIPPPAAVPSQLMLPARQEGLLVGQPQQAAKTSAAGATAAMLLAQDAPASMPQPKLAGSRKRADPEEDEELPDVLPASDGKAQQNSAVDQEPTLGERVAALQLDEDQAEPTNGAQQAEPAETSISGRITAESLTTLLTQAVRSGDKALLERCLQMGNNMVVTNTVRGLAPGDAAEVLQAVVARLQSKASRGTQLAGWLRPLLLHHAAHFASLPGVQPVLVALYQAIEARLAMQNPLLSLAGRLDLLTAHIPAGERGNTKTGPPYPAQVVYRESDSEGESEAEAEDAMAPVMADMNGLESEEESDDEDDSESNDSDLSIN